ncbi:hypothetical protein RQ831_05260 [Roseomonas gilardii]|uniref:Uncharacterized protein n=1 Tax=Roseomonas gilardii TaxID=257708 RepID=A0ABU3MCZ4_9PROT|nr:hypothetical protein [Roseomonas gilardii]MDT8330453.1 hypothetical protein [Roseomonas gilardii]
MAQLPVAALQGPACVQVATHDLMGAMDATARFILRNTKHSPQDFSPAKACAAKMQQLNRQVVAVLPQLHDSWAARSPRRIRLPARAIKMETCQWPNAM